jgi:hypothetical protein
MVIVQLGGSRVGDRGQRKDLSRPHVIRQWDRHVGELTYIGHMHLVCDKSLFGSNRLNAVRRLSAITIFGPAGNAATAVSILRTDILWPGTVKRTCGIGHRMDLNQASCIDVFRQRVALNYFLHT